MKMSIPRRLSNSKIPQNMRATTCAYFYTMSYLQEDDPNKIKPLPNSDILQPCLFLRGGNIPKQIWVLSWSSVSKQHCHLNLLTKLRLVFFWFDFYKNLGILKARLDFLECKKFHATKEWVQR